MFRTRDTALIMLVALIVVVAMVCATVLAVHLHTDATVTAGFGLLTAGVGIAGVALGRLSGASAAPAEVDTQPDAGEIDALVGDAA